jgi:hypothetical protein
MTIKQFVHGLRVAQLGALQELRICGVSRFSHRRGPLTYLPTSAIMDRLTMRVNDRRGNLRAGMISSWYRARNANVRQLAGEKRTAVRRGGYEG